MNAISHRPEIDKLTPAGLRQKVVELIPAFQEFCLHSNYDVIIPIENEGLSILFPVLPLESDTPIIIPSSSLESMDSGALNGKNVLIEDVSVYSGKTILRIKNLLQTTLQAANVEIAALIAYEEINAKLVFEFEEMLMLSQNRYDWAREAIAHYIETNVLYHYGDPPLWDFHFPGNKRGALYQSLKELGTFYSLPDYSGDSSTWHHFSLDNVELSNRDWLPSFVEVEEFIKIRIFVHKSLPRLVALPLFFPVISQHVEGGLFEILSKAQELIPPSLVSFLRQSDNGSQDAFLYFRWISTVGSMLLLAEFQKRMLNIGFDFIDESPLIIGPPPNLQNYSFSSEALKAFESTMHNMLVANKEATQNNKFLLLDTIFSFPKADTDIWFRDPNDKVVNNLLPEKYLARRIGSASKDYSFDATNSTPAIQTMDKPLFTYPMVQNLAPDLTKVGLNRSLDVLLDGGVLNTCMSYDERHNLRRGYYVAGESLRLLEVLNFAEGRIA